MKRYSHSQAAGMVRSTNGAFVLHSDAHAALAAKDSRIAELEAECGRLRNGAVIAELRNQRDEVIAENGELQNALKFHALRGDFGQLSENQRADLSKECNRLRERLKQAEDLMSESVGCISVKSVQDMVVAFLAQKEQSNEQ